MQSLKLDSPWHQVKEKMKEINIDLTDEDLAYEPGKEDDLFARLQQKMKGSKEDIKGIIESISSNKGKAG